MCLYALKEYEGFVNLSSNKGKAVRFLYKNVCAYSERFSGKHKKEFTEYKKGVIVAFLINELDLIKPKIEPHNQTLYDKIKKDLKSNKATI